MKRPQVIALAAVVGLASLAGLVFLATRHSPLATRAGSFRTTYYCPMHPTFTSDRPVDCPICNMKMVKRPTAAAAHTAQPAHQDATAHLQSICYLHNCPKLHEGKPCPMTVVAKPGEAVTCPICGTHVAEAAPAKSERKILYWTDPMIPGFKADGPGTSPMGMDLVPVYEEAAAPAAGGPVPEGYAPVLLTPQKQQLIGVKTAVVARRIMTKTIRTVGRIAYDPDLYQTEAEYLQSLKTLEQAKAGGAAPRIEEAQRLVDSSRMKLRLMGLSDELIEEMAEWEGPDKSLLLSDASGRVWLYAPIYEFELPFVAVGQMVKAEIPPATGKTLEGIIRAIDAVLDPTTRSARVRAVLTDSEKLLKPEMYVNASIVVTLGDVLVVPEEAVFDTGTKRVVFVEKGQGLFEPRDVAVGLKADGYYEVKSGVVEGERVVTSGNFLIDSESRLKGALQGTESDTHRHGP